MTFIFLIALAGIIYYLLSWMVAWVRGGPTMGDDLRSLFGGRRSRDSAIDHERIEATDPSQRDGHTIDADPELTDADRVEEILELTDLWNKSNDAETEKRDS